MQLLVLDFETRYKTSVYTLKKQTTEEYVRDPRFKAHGCSIRWPNGQIVWYTHSKLVAVFASIDWSQTTILCHNAHFDAYILATIYGHHPRMIFCTLAMANMLRPHNRKSLDELATFFGLKNKTVPYGLFDGVDDLPEYIDHQVGEGCCHDVWLNYEIFMRFMRGAPALDLPAFPQSELEAMSLTIQMFTQPCLNIDIDRAEALATRTIARKADMLRKLAALLFGKRWDNYSDIEVVDEMRRTLASRERFAELLTDMGVTPPMKPARGANAKPGEMTFAFAKSDAGMKALLEGDNETVLAQIEENLANRATPSQIVEAISNANLAEPLTLGQVVALVCEAKLSVGSTISETRAARYAATARRGQPVPVFLKFASTFSLRTAGGDKMNWSNVERLPNKDKAGNYELGADGHVRKGEIRLCVKAPKDHMLVIIDFAQVEARMLATTAGQWDLVERFRRDEDVYSIFIEPHYGYPISKATPSERGVGKQLILSCGYLAGAATIKVTAALGSYGPPVHLTLEEAETLKQYYRRQNWAIANYWDQVDQIIPLLADRRSAQFGPIRIEDGRAFLPGGAFLDYTTLHRYKAKDDDPDWVKRDPGWSMKTLEGYSRIHKGIVTAHFTSSLSRVLMNEALVRVGRRFKVALTCYDEMALCVPKGQAEEALAFATAEMKRAPLWLPGMPVGAEGHITPIYDK